MIDLHLKLKKNIYTHLLLSLCDPTGNREVSRRCKSFHAWLLQQPGVSGLQPHLTRVRVILIFSFSLTV